MKVVAISQRLIENDTYPETRDCLDVRWAELCSRLGVLPLVLPTKYDPAAYFDAFAPSGLILTGGNDLSSVSASPLSVLRDDFEKRVLSLAVERRIPVLAVCRGMQFVAAHFGAALEKVTGHSGVEHAVSVVATTRHGEALKGLSQVNSYHGYGITKLPEGFTEIARSTDGVIEAMAHVTLPIFCQMWHPEREGSLNDGEKELLRELFGVKEEGS